MEQAGVEVCPVSAGTWCTDRGDERKKTVFAGDLADMPMAGLLQSLQLSEASAHIRVRVQTDAGVQRGELDMHRGCPLFARFGASESEDAVYRMVALADGQFRVDFGPVPIQRGNITMSLPSLLMESARQQDELARVRDALPPWDAKLRGSGEAPTMSRDEQQLALRCDGTRTIEEIVDGAANALEAATMLRDLVERGALVVARPPSVVVTLSRPASRETSGVIEAPDAVQPRPQRETTQPRPSLPRRAGLQTLGALVGIGTLASAIAFVVPTSETTAAPKSSGATPVVIASPAPMCPADSEHATPELCADRHLVTASAYRACVRDEHCSPATAKIAAARIRDGRRQGLDVRCTASLDGREDDPVNCITQAQAIEYCDWVGKRLPTDVESHDAARVVDVQESLAEWTSSSVSVEDPSSVSVSGGTRGYAGRVANAEQGDFAIGFRCVASPGLPL